MGMDAYLIIVVGFEIDEPDVEKYEKVDRKFGEVIFNSSDSGHPYVFGLPVKECDGRRGYFYLFQSFTSEDVKEHIDFYKKLIDGAVEAKNEIKLYIIYDFSC